MQEELGQHEMARQVVLAVAEHAVLFRERLQLAPLGTLPVGGVRVRARAVPQTASLCKGMFREAGKTRNKLSPMRDVL